VHTQVTDVVIDKWHTANWCRYNYDQMFGNGTTVKQHTVSLVRWLWINACNHKFIPSLSTLWHFQEFFVLIPVIHTYTYIKFNKMKDKTLSSLHEVNVW